MLLNIIHWIIYILASVMAGMFIFRLTVWVYKFITYKPPKDFVQQRLSDSEPVGSPSKDLENPKRWI